MLYKKDDFCGFIVTIESKTERKKKMVLHCNFGRLCWFQRIRIISSVLGFWTEYSESLPWILTNPALSSKAARLQGSDIKYVRSGHVGHWARRDAAMTSQTLGGRDGILTNDDISKTSTWQVSVATPASRTWGGAKPRSHCALQVLLGTEKP